jgi:hypothetical protein
LYKFEVVGSTYVIVGIKRSGALTEEETTGNVDESNSD